MLTLLLLACGGAAPIAKDDTSTADTATVDTAPPHDFVGVAPDSPVALPDFTATNRDGTGRGPADLRGSPTVMWFYPAANTYG
jgi:hypothetical protein